MTETETETETEGEAETEAASGPAWSAAFDARAVPPAIRTAMRLLELEQVDVPAIDDLATRVGWSPAHFSRQFALAFAQTSAAYGRRIRLDHAVNRMRFDPAPLGVIARLFGFRDQAAFNRAFRRQHGASPRQFVDALRRRDAVHRGRPGDDRPAFEPPSEVVVAQRPPTLAYARRFFGPDWAAHWARFEADLPIDLPAHPLRAGLAWDHPAVTPAAYQRYDCAVVVGEDAALGSRLTGLPGLDAVELPGGWHAELSDLPALRAVPAAIGWLVGNWLSQQSAFAPEGDPLVHRRAAPDTRWTATIRLHQRPEPPVWNLMPLDDRHRPLGRR